MAHRSCGQFQAAAAIFLWLGDPLTAAYDCILRGMRDWQLALVVARLAGDQDTVDKVVW